MVFEITGSVVEFGDFRHMIVEIKRSAIAKIAHFIVPTEREFPTSCTHIRHVLQRRGRTYHGGQFYAISEHTHRRAVIPIKHELEAVAEHIQVRTDIKRAHRFPGVVGSNQAGSGDYVYELAFVEPHVAARNIHASDKAIGSNVLIADAAIRSPNLEVIEILARSFHKRLLADSPSAGNGGEEAESVLLGELTAAIVSAVAFNQVAPHVVVSYSSERADDSILREAVLHHFLAGSTLERRHAHHRLPLNGVKLIGHAVALLVVTGYHAQVMAIEVEVVVRKEIERMILGGNVVFLILILASGGQRSGAQLRIAYRELPRVSTKELILLLIGVFSGDRPSLERLEDGAEHDTRGAGLGSGSRLIKATIGGRIEDDILALAYKLTRHQAFRIPVMHAHRIDIAEHVHDIRTPLMGVIQRSFLRKPFAYIA